MVVWAEVKTVLSWDVDLNSYKISHTPVLLEMAIGQKDSRSDGGDSYRFMIITPEEIRSIHQNELPDFGRGYFIVDALNSHSLRNAVETITQRINSTWGRDWHEVSIKLSWYGIGEFEYLDTNPPLPSKDGIIVNNTHLDDSYFDDSDDQRNEIDPEISEEELKQVNKFAQEHGWPTLTENLEELRKAEYLEE